MIFNFLIKILYGNHLPQHKGNEMLSSIDFIDNEIVIITQDIEEKSGNEWLRKTIINSFKINSIQRVAIIISKKTDYITSKVYKKIIANIYCSGSQPNVKFIFDNSNERSEVYKSLIKLINLLNGK